MSGSVVSTGLNLLSLLIRAAKSRCACRSITQKYSCWSRSLFITNNLFKSSGFAANQIQISSPILR